MQTADEQDHLVTQIVATAEVIGNVISAAAAAMIAEDLECYPHLVCCEALKRCRAEVRGRLTLSDVVSRIVSQDGRPSRDEAWAIALQSSDERDTVIWTTEIMRAFEAARPVLSAGDKVGARMAFLAAYDRLVQSGRDSLRPVQWDASYGWDAELRQKALESAVALERLSADRAVVMGYLSAPVTADGRAIAGLLTGSTVTAPSSDVSKRLQELKAELVNRRKDRIDERNAWFEAEAEDFKRKKLAVQKSVETMLGAQQ